MKIVADENIPLLEALFHDKFDLHAYPTEALTRKNIRGADILLCRSVTRVDADLLEGSQIKIVGSATSGIDHIDHTYLSAQGITLLSAPGANAPAVVDYVTSILALMNLVHHTPTKKAAIIGVGHVGSQLLDRFTRLGIECFLNDPYRVSEPGFQSMPLNKMSDVDLVSLHTPLTHDDPYPTHHLIDAEFIKSLKPGCVIINSARGGVLDEAAFLEHGKHLTLCLDVFENEPDINPEILERCLVATPHIAGHAIESKERASTVLYQTICQILEIPTWNKEYRLKHSQHSSQFTNIHQYHQHCLQYYNPQAETRELQALKDLCPNERITGFKTLRGHHQRHEIS